MADEGPPPNEDVFEDVDVVDDDGEDAEANEDAEAAPPPRLLERIANNDPNLSTLLDLGNFFDLGEPKVEDEENGALGQDWWGEFSISDLGPAGGDTQRIELCERHLVEATEALQKNTSIKHVRIDALFRFELLFSRLPWTKSLALLQALYRLPNLESFEMDDQHECRLSEFIDVLDNDKLQRLKIGRLNVEGSDRISILADKLRGHSALKEVSFDMDFEPSKQTEHLLEQTYIVDPLFDAFATIPNLDQLSLTCNHLYTTSIAQPLQNLLRHPKLLILSLRGLLPNNRLLCQTVVETLGRNKANLDIIDLSFPFFILGPRGRWKNSPSLWFTQEMAEMLFSLVERQPLLKVKVSCFFSRRERKSIVLNTPSDANWYLRKAEVMRAVRLEKAGMRNLLVSKDGGAKAAWVDVLTRVSDDAQAVFHVLKEQPSICDETKPGDEKITNELAGTHTPGNIRYQAKPKLKKRKFDHF